ncbi:MAG: sodium/proton-translocating pyrophosphatase, partial [Candidatus Binatia bacterium]|nr:sodium/proton-translocating pyrophosphatase [Candidatus Binatia bacterium]
MLVLTLGISVFGLLYAYWLARFVLQEGTGTEGMRAIADAIKEGAEAFLRRQYRTIGILSVAVALLIYVLYAFAKGDPEQAWRTTVAFLFGAFCSALAGYIGMFISIRANIRTANAVRTSMDRALKISFRGGAVS